MSDYAPGSVINAGADTALNDTRRITVRAAIIHRPQGRCPGVVAIGTSRHHSTPGTFNETVCDDGTLHGHYPADVRCSHAAGANYTGPGAEVDGYQGEALTVGALRALGRSILHKHHDFGLPLRLYPPSAPRIWLDRDGPVAGFGFYNHSSIDYPPNRTFLHYDGITEAEFARAIELAGGGTDDPTDDRRRKALLLWA